MAIINERTREQLKEENAEDLMTSLDWSVQEDPSLHGASINEVRRSCPLHSRPYSLCVNPANKPCYRRFHEWIAASGVHRYFTPRYEFCIHVDTTALESVFDGPQPPEFDDEGLTYVNLVDAQYPVDPATFDWENAGKGPATDDPADEGEEEFEGSKQYDLGWMRLNASMIAPRAYNVMGGSGWEGNYSRPPEIVSP